MLRNNFIKIVENNFGIEFEFTQENSASGKYNQLEPLRVIYVDILFQEPDINSNIQILKFTQQYLYETIKDKENLIQINKNEQCNLDQRLFIKLNSIRSIKKNIQVDTNKE